MFNFNQLAPPQEYGNFSNNTVLSFVEDNFFPIPFFLKSRTTNDQEDGFYISKSWRRRVDSNVLYYLTVIFSLGAWNVISTITSRDHDIENDSISTDLKNDTTHTSYNTTLDEISVFKESICPTKSRAYLQFTMVHTQLMIILGLCWDKKESLTSKIFCSKAMQFFGRISMSLYLVHEPLIFYIQLCFYGNLNWEDNKGKPPLPSPIWTVPIHITLSLILGIFITIFIEEPARKKFKEWNEKLKDSKDNLNNENKDLVCKHVDMSTN